MMQGTNILIRGYYGKKNLGDDYILYSVLSMLNNLDTKYRISVIVETLGDNFQWLFPRFKNIKCKAVPVRKNVRFAQNKDTRQYTKHTQLFIIGGGGLFPNLTWKMSAALYFDTFFAKRNHSKILIYGIDLSCMTGALSKLFWKKSGEKLHLNCVEK